MPHKARADTFQSLYILALRACIGQLLKTPALIVAKEAHFQKLGLVCHYK
jgi:hypothetical protein